MDVLELINQQGLRASWVAAQLGIGRQGFYVSRYATGNLNPLEIDRLAEVLRLPREQVEAAVRESARRHAAAKAPGPALQPSVQPKGGAA